MSKLCEKDTCTGCMACYNACPVGAVTVKEDDLGVLVPEIKEDKCIDCKKCTRVCPMLNEVEKAQPKQAYALYTKDAADRKTCASGGVATTFSRWVIGQGGVVFGSGFDQQSTPVFKKATKTEQLEEFKGSKYVYVFPGLIYRDVLKELKEGKLCLFVGTPCQVDGLKRFLNKDYDNLVTVDLICHGTPPFSYLKEWLEYKGVDYNAYSVKPEFRGRKDYFLTVRNEDDKILYSKRINEDVYFESFMSGLISRQSCYSCEYATEKRVSDITIGDFWRIEKGALDGYKGKISVALINTERGENFLKELSDKFVFEKREVKEAVDGNAQLRCPSRVHTERAEFLKGYIAEKSFVKAIKKTSVVRAVTLSCIKNKVLKIPRFIVKKMPKK